MTKRGDRNTNTNDNDNDDCSDDDDQEADGARGNDDDDDTLTKVFSLARNSEYLEIIYEKKHRKIK